MEYEALAPVSSVMDDPQFDRMASEFTVREEVNREAARYAQHVDVHENIRSFIDIPDRALEVVGRHMLGDWIAMAEDKDKGSHATVRTMRRLHAETGAVSAFLKGGAISRATPTRVGVWRTFQDLLRSTKNGYMDNRQKRHNELRNAIRKHVCAVFNVSCPIELVIPGGSTDGRGERSGPGAGAR